MLALALGALLSLQPWATDSLAPDLRVSPDIGIGLGDSVAVDSAGAGGGGIEVADARVAPAGRAAFVDRSTNPAKHTGGVESDRGPELGVAEARVVRGPEPASPVPPEHLVPTEPPAPMPVAASPAPGPAAQPAPAPLPVSTLQLVADFENGLQGWSTAEVGDTLPAVVSGFAEDGSKVAVVRLTGSQSSSQLILGGDGGASADATVRAHEGEEYAFAFSFNVRRMVYGVPGADNLIMQLESDASEDLGFGLQLWDYAADDWQGVLPGLWSSGEAVGGDRLLTPLTERAWHDVVVHFRASSQGSGFYEVFFDGELVDAREGVSVIVPGSSYAEIEVGLFRDAERVRGTSEVFLDAAKLGATLDAVQSE